MPTQDYRKLDGTPVPGTTTIIGQGLGWGSQALIQWAAKCAKEGKDYAEERDKAARIGTITHARIEQYLGGEKVDLEKYAPDEVAESEAPYKAFREWKEGTDLRVIHRELPIVSECFGYGGTLDLYCQLQGRLAIVDFKTSRTIHPSHIVQVSAYRQLAVEHFCYHSPRVIEQVVLLHLPRGCKRAKPLTVSDAALDEGASVFNALLRIYRAQPKLASKNALTNGVGS